MDKCIFCKIIKRELPAYLVYEDEEFIVFLDLFPVNPGHLLIVPKMHQSYLFDLSEPLYSKTFALSKKIATALKLATKAQRIGIIVEGFGVDHTHVHLIPINKTKELDPNRAYAASETELAQMQNNIKGILSM